MPLERCIDEGRRSELNKFALQEFQRYQNLNVLGHLINCPYYIDTPVSQIIDQMRESNIPEELIANFYNLHKRDASRFGRYSGKGTPSEIEDSIKLFLQTSFDPSSVTNEGIVQLMKLKGLGVDCSGLVFNILLVATSKIGRADEFLGSLAWSDSSKKHVRRAGTIVFGEAASMVIQPDEVRELDLILMPKHIAIVLKENSLLVCQSSPWTIPDGVSVSNLNIANNTPKFDLQTTMGKNWNQKFLDDELSFRRLKIFA